MKLAMVVLLAMACGKGDSTKSSGSGGGSAAAPQPPTASTKIGAKGSVTTSGELVGTFDWKDDLALTCAWIPDLGTGGLSITMTDGAGTFIAIDAHYGKERTSVSFSSGKVQGGFDQKAGGVVITGVGHTGGDAPVTVTAQIDAVTTNGDRTVKVKGTIVATCN